MDLTLIRWMLDLTPAERLQVLHLGLVALIKAKEETAAEKDKAVLAFLRRTLEEKRKR